MLMPLYLNQRRLLACRLGLLLLPAPTHLAIVAADVESASGRVVFVHDLYARHEARDPHVVVAVLKGGHTHTLAHSNST